MIEVVKKLNKYDGGVSFQLEIRNWVRSEKRENYLNKLEINYNQDSGILAWALRIQMLLGTFRGLLLV